MSSTIIGAIAGTFIGITLSIAYHEYKLRKIKEELKWVQQLLLV